MTAVGSMAVGSAAYGMDSNHPNIRAVIDSPPTRMYKRPLGFQTAGSAGNTVPAGVQSRYQANTQVLIRGGRLIVPSTIAENYQLVEFMIGLRSQFSSNASVVDAITMSQVAAEAGLLCDTCEIGQNIILTVLNVDTVPHIFRATLIGDVAQS